MDDEHQMPVYQFYSVFYALG